MSSGVQGGDCSGGPHGITTSEDIIAARLHEQAKKIFGRGSSPAPPAGGGRGASSNLRQADKRRWSDEAVRRGKGDRGGIGSGGGGVDGREEGAAAPDEAVMVSGGGGEGMSGCSRKDFRPNSGGVEGLSSCSSLSSSSSSVSSCSREGAGCDPPRFRLSEFYAGGGGSETGSGSGDGDERGQGLGLEEMVQGETTAEDVLMEMKEDDVAEIDRISSEQTVEVRKSIRLFCATEFLVCL